MHVIPRPREVLTLSSVLFNQALAVIKHTHWQEVNDNTHTHTRTHSPSAQDFLSA